jgi:hypothetical protein
VPGKQGVVASSVDACPDESPWPTRVLARGGRVPTIQGSTSPFPKHLIRAQNLISSSPAPQLFCLPAFSFASGAARGERHDTTREALSRPALGSPKYLAGGGGRGALKSSSPGVGGLIAVLSELN